MTETSTPRQQGTAPKLSRADLAHVARHHAREAEHRDAADNPPGA